MRISFIPLILAGCATTTTLTRTIDVDERLKPYVDELVETAQKDLWPIPLHALKAIEFAPLPQDTIGECPGDANGMTIRVNDAVSKLSPGQIRETLTYLVIYCLTPQPANPKA